MVTGEHRMREINHLKTGPYVEYKTNAKVASVVANLTREEKSKSPQDVF